MVATLRAFAGALLLGLAAAVSPSELKQWYGSPNGLGMSPPAAQKLADQTWNSLTLGDVSVAALQALKDMMAGTLGMTMEAIRAEIVPIADHHVAPGKLKQLYKALSSGYTVSGGLGYPAAEAARKAIPLAKAKFQVIELYDLFKVMYGYSGLGFTQDAARAATLQLSLAGTDALVFKDQYKKAISSGSKPQEAMAAAVKEGVNAYTTGLAQRYAKDVKAYYSSEFQDHYGAQWLGEWLSAPLELRVSTDMKEHSVAWFKTKFGSGWEAQYKTAAEAIQMRAADDGKPYNMRAFQSHYGTSAWQAVWADAPEAPCSVCAPFGARAGAATPEVTQLVV